MLPANKRCWNRGDIGRCDDEVLYPRQVLPESDAAAGVEFGEDIVQHNNRIARD
jgi:hypothetical protein